MHLKPFNEIIGNLISVEKQENNLRLLFAIDQEIEIPLGGVPKEKLDSLINKKIGILNCEGNFLIREIRSKQT